MNLVVADNRSHVAGRALVVPLWPTLFAATVLLALGLRLGALDSVPLSPDEAARALEALAIWRGTAGDYSAGPLLPNLLAVWFGLFTPADGPARVPSALAGSATCLLPLLYRGRLGSGAALGACFLLAISPLGVLASRSVHPAALVAFASLATLACFLRAVEHRDGRWLIAAALAIGVGLGSSTAFVGQLVALGLAAAIYPPIPHRPRWNLQADLPKVALAGLLAALLFDTLLLTRPGGLQGGLVDPFALWLGNLGVSSATAWSHSLLGIHNVLLIVLAAFGALVARETRFGRFLAAWTLSTAAMAALSKTPDLAPVTALNGPLALLGGLGLAKAGWLGRARRPAIWLTGLAALVPLVFLVLATNLAANRGAALQVTPVLIAVGGLVAIGLFMSSFLGPDDLGTAFGLAALVGLLALELTFLARLSYAGFERAGPALLGQSSRPAIRQVELRAHDWRRQDPDQPIQVESSLRPVLEWSLRDGPPVEWVRAAPTSADRAILGPLTASSRPAASWLRLEVAERYGVPAQSPGPLSIWRWMVQQQPLARSEPYVILIAN